jgi:hypothetical protein
MYVIKNLTPHVCNLVNGDGTKIDIRPEVGVISPRVSMEQTKPVKVLTQHGEIDYTETVMGEVMNLPPIEINVLLIVSRVVYEAAGKRPDLRIPGPAVRDGNGAVIGARGISR